MKILSLTNNNYNYLSNSVSQNRIQINNTVSYDKVTFTASKDKVIKKSADKLVENILNNAGDSLGSEIKKIMSQPVGRNVFTTTLAALALTVTKLIMNQDSVQDETSENTITAIPAKSTKTKEAEEKNAATQKEGKRSYITAEKKEELKKIFQEMADKGYNQKEMSEEQGMSQSSVSKYLKEFDIKTTKTRGKISTTTPKTTKKSIEEKLNDFIAEKPERKAYIKNIEPYKDLSREYARLMTECVKNKDNANQKQSISGLEKIFGLVTNLPTRFQKQYFENLETLYAENIEQVGIIFDNIQPGTTVQESLTNFIANKYDKETLNEWVKFPACTYDELKTLESLSEGSKIAIHELKKEGTFTFEVLKDNERNNHKFILHFVEDIELAQKLKTIAAFHEAINGNIYIHKDTGNRLQRYVTLKEELLILVSKDKNLDSVVNVLKYIEPEKLKNLNYDCSSCKTTDEMDKYNSKVRGKIETIINNLDENNQRLKNLEEIVNDDYIFENILSNCHAKLRFVSRFVLNHEVRDGELYNSCEEAFECLKDDLNQKIDDKCCVFPYRFQESTAPCFYLAKSKLGDYIRVTLNNHGQIHTIYEDGKLKNRYT